jgi:hypothetical protein
MTMDVTLSELRQLLNLTPTYVHVHPVSLAFFEETVELCRSDEELFYLLDSPTPMSPRPIVIQAEQPMNRARFPFVICKHDPFTSELNKILFERWDFIRQHMLCQSQLADRLIQESEDYDTIALLVVDGLSFEESRSYTNWNNTEPCLVDGPSRTRDGFFSIIGDPPIAMRLFHRGFTKQLGFSYWDQENGNIITNRIFQTIHKMFKIETFEQAIEILEQEDIQSTYMSGITTSCTFFSTKVVRSCITTS